MVKKKELKVRAIYVYPPTREMADHWKSLAQESGLSVSRFVIEHMEGSLNSEQDGYTSRAVLLDEIKQLREALQEKEKRVDHLELLVERLEEDLKLFRASMFTDEGFSGVRSYDRKLIAILREPGFHSSEELFSRLRIKSNEVEAVKAISRQLENLEQYGLLRTTPRGWEWVE